MVRGIPAFLDSFEKNVPDQQHVGKKDTYRASAKELLDGKRVDYPPSRGNITFEKAPKAKEEGLQMPFDTDEA